MKYSNHQRQLLFRELVGLDQLHILIPQLWGKNMKYFLNLDTAGFGAENDRFHRRAGAIRSAPKRQKGPGIAAQAQ
jgi:hypothetical protein